MSDSLMEKPHQVASQIFLVMLTASMLSVFVALPLGLPILGVSPLNSIAMAILALGCYTDAFTTKYGFKLGGSELNPLYRKTKKHLSQNQFLIAGSLTKIGVGLALLVLLPNPYLLFLIALYSLSGVLFNSVGLAFTTR